MAFLTIAGTDYFVLTEGATEEDPSFGGVSPEFSYSGKMRSAFVVPRRAWRVRLKPMSRTTYESLRTAIGSGAVTCTGDMFGGVSASYLVRVTGAELLADGTGFLIVPSLDLIQSGL
jgi:hypothetical protein